MRLFLILLALAIVGFICYEVGHYVCFYWTSRTRYYDRYDKGYITMSWKELRDFYKVNPSRWFFGKTSEYQDVSHLYYIVKPEEWYVVNISMFSYFRLLWNYHFGNPMTEDKETVLKCVQSDIDEIKIKAQEELEEANAMMEEVKNRLERSKT